MGLALYRKYRSKSLDDIVGQDHIKTVLKNAVQTGHIKHAYLFTGPRGVGKTSIARILAHEINNVPYAEDTNYLDIIEIDAASNRRIDEIRDLRDKVHIAPATAKYKIYIIDEVHMLTKEAFNALLKTLEEPPEHVVFILATTESHKVPETISSRTQRFTFHPVPTELAVQHLATIAQKEGIIVDTDVLTTIVEHAHGSLRDSLNMLDQLRSGSQKISSTSVIELLGIPDTDLITDLLQATLQGNSGAVIEQLNTARINGLHAAAVASLLSQQIRLLIMNKHDYSQDLVITLDKLLSVPQSTQPYTTLELCLLSFTTKLSVPTPPIKSKQQIQSTTVPTPKVVKNDIHTESKPEIQSPPIQEQPSASITTHTPGNEWQAVLDEIKSSHNTLYSILRMAQPHVYDDEIVLTFSFGFHQKQVDQPGPKEVTTKAVHKAYGKKMRIKTEVSSQKSKTATHIQNPVSKVEKNESGHLKDVSNIFEGAELLD